MKWNLKWKCGRKNGETISPMLFALERRKTASKKKAKATDREQKI